MPLYALTGGIAAGKSTVAARLSELGAHVISADELVRFVQRRGSDTLAAIERRFGFGVITEDGELDRAALGRLIFDDGHARRDLEAIVHPAIGIEFHSRVAAIRETDPSAVIIYDIPLLVETNRMHEFDGSIVLVCPPEIRHARLMTHRGLSSDDAWARITAQATEDQRIAVADWTVDTSGTLEQTLERTNQLWDALSNRG